jgi:endonuclease YncB( thermonuclease family)
MNRRIRRLAVPCVLIVLLLALTGSSVVAAPECGCDVNGDGGVDILDLVAVSARYGHTRAAGLPPNAPEDTNGDGKVCIDDLVCVSANYGRGITGSSLQTEPLPSEQVECCPSLVPPVACQPAWVVQVMDADTIGVRLGSELLWVQLLNVNAPEDGQHCAVEAKREAERLLLNQAVCLESDPNAADLDMYGRLLRHVWIGERLAQSELARIGMVRIVEYDSRLGRNKYLLELLQIEEEARTERLGSWGTTCAVQ